MTQSETTPGKNHAVLRAKASFTCLHCRRPVAATRLGSHYDCDTCGHGMELGSTFWARLFQSRALETLGVKEEPGEDEEEDEADEEDDPPATGAWTDMYYDTVAVLDLDPVDTPACRRCDTPLEATWSDRAVTSVACAGCGLAHGVRPAGEIERAIHGGIHTVVGEVDAEGAALETTLQCGHCKAPLHPDGSTRALECDACHQVTWVPDRYWRSLRPANVRVPMYLIVDTAVAQPETDFEPVSAAPSVAPVPQPRGRFAVGARISIDCVECRAPIPVGAIVPGARCHTCGFDVPLDWIDWFILIGLHVAAVDEGGLLGSKVVNLGDLISHVEYSGTPPRCRRCDHVFEKLDDLMRAAPDGGLSCPGCGHHLPVRRGDALAAEGVHPGVVCVVGETMRPTLPKVSITCLDCGAPLSVDGSERAVKCDYCRETNYLSDALWLHLHPEHAPSWLWVICDRKKKK